MVTLSWQTIITAAAVITAAVTIMGRYNKLYDFIKRQEEQDEQIKAHTQTVSMLIIDKKMMIDWVEIGEKAGRCYLT